MKKKRTFQLLYIYSWYKSGIAPNGRERRGAGVSDEGKAAKCMLLLSSLVLSFAPYT
jgi:hypothetical protein